MAPVTRPRDRGQLILVAGLTVAVILVVLVLLLNTVIYTENLATRGIDSGAGDAIEYRTTVVGSVEELIERENERYDEDHPPVCDSPCVGGVDAGIRAINDHLQERYLQRGMIAEVQYDGEEDINRGNSIVWQAESGGFTGGTILMDVNHIERFGLTVNPEQFTENAEDPFRVLVGDWSMEIDVVFENGTEDRIRVTVQGEEESSFEYDYGAAPLEIDLVEGSIEANGDELSGKSGDIDPVPVDNSEIEYQNGDMVTGTFEIQSDGSVVESNLTEYDGGSGEEPYYTYLVKNVDLTIQYETDRVRFVTTDKVPEEA